MGNLIAKKEHVCALCNSEDCGKKKVICDECQFVQKFMVQYGRNTLHDITVNHDRSRRPRVVQMPQLPPPPVQPERYNTWSHPTPAHPSAPLTAAPPPQYNHEDTNVVVVGSRYPKNY